MRKDAREARLTHGARLVATALAIAILALMLLPEGAHAGFSPDFGVEISDDTTGTNADVSTEFGIDAPDYNFGATVTIIPPEWGVAPDDEVPDGAVVGELTSLATLGLINGPCASSLPVSFTLLDATTDTGNSFTYNAATEPISSPDWPGYDIMPSGLERAVEQYPDFLNDLFQGAVPRARYYGHTFVAGSHVPIQFIVFEPGQSLPNLPGAVLGLGYPSVTVLQDPTATAGPSPITDFCTPLESNTTTYGLSEDNPDTSEDESGFPVRTNPCAPGTYTFTSFARSLLDADNDGVENGMDTCPFLTNVDENPRDGSGPDGDGIDSACDPNPGKSDGSDTDADGYMNRGDNCPLLPNGVAADNQEDDDTDGIGDACEGDIPEDDPWQCGDAIDDDGDTRVNDGCPAEVDAETVCDEERLTCADADGKAPWDNCDDDGDTKVNDGCPAFGYGNPGRADGSPIEETIEEDVDIVGSDVCPVEETPTPTPTPAPLDTDGDGFDDAVETDLGSDPADPESTPEHATVEDTCTDGVDNDKDGLTDAEDEGCEATPTATATPPPTEGEFCPPVFPGIYNGLVRIDGMPADPGYEVAATIDGTEWGRALVSGGRYAMDIPAQLPIFQPDCFPGGTLTFSIDGMTCAPTVEWASGVQNVDLECATPAAPTATPPPATATPPPGTPTPTATPTATAIPTATPTATPTVTPAKPPVTGSGGLGGAGSSPPLWVMALIGWAGLMTMAGLGVLTLAKAPGAVGSPHRRTSLHGAKERFLSLLNRFVRR